MARKKKRGARPVRAFTQPTTQLREVLGLALLSDVMTLRGEGAWKLPVAIDRLRPHYADLGSREKRLCEIVLIQLKSGEIESRDLDELLSAKAVPQNIKETILAFLLLYVPIEELPKLFSHCVPYQDLILTVQKKLLINSTLHEKRASKVKLGYKAYIRTIIESDLFVASREAIVKDVAAEYCDTAACPISHCALFVISMPKASITQMMFKLIRHYSGNPSKLANTMSLLGHLKQYVDLSAVDRGGLTLFDHCCLLEAWQCFHQLTLFHAGVPENAFPNPVAFGGSFTVGLLSLSDLNRQHYINVGVNLSVGLRLRVFLSLKKECTPQSVFTVCAVLEELFPHLEDATQLAEYLKEMGEVSAPEVQSIRALLDFYFKPVTVIRNALSSDEKALQDPVSFLVTALMADMPLDNGSQLFVLAIWLARDEFAKKTILPFLKGSNQRKISAQKIDLSCWVQSVRAKNFLGKLKATLEVKDKHLVEQWISGLSNLIKVVNMKGNGDDAAAKAAESWGWGLNYLINLAKRVSPYFAGAAEDLPPVSACEDEAEREAKLLAELESMSAVGGAGAQAVTGSAVKTRQGKRKRRRRKRKQAEEGVMQVKALTPPLCVAMKPASTPLPVLDFADMLVKHEEHLSDLSIYVERLSAEQARDLWKAYSQVFSDMLPDAPAWLVNLAKQAMSSSDDGQRWYLRLKVAVQFSLSTLSGDFDWFKVASVNRVNRSLKSRSRCYKHLGKVYLDAPFNTARGATAQYQREYLFKSNTYLTGILLDADFSLSAVLAKLKVWSEDPSSLPMPVDQNARKDFLLLMSFTCGCLEHNDLLQGVLDQAVKYVDDNRDKFPFIEESVFNEYYSANAHSNRLELGSSTSAGLAGERTLTLRGVGFFTPPRNHSPASVSPDFSSASPSSGSAFSEAPPQVGGSGCGISSSPGSDKSESDTSVLPTPASQIAQNKHQLKSTGSAKAAEPKVADGFKTPPRVSTSPRRMLKFSPDRPSDAAVYTPVASAAAGSRTCVQTPKLLVLSKADSDAGAGACVQALAAVVKADIELDVRERLVPHFQALARKCRQLVCCIQETHFNAYVSAVISWAEQVCVSLDAPLSLPSKFDVGVGRISSHYIVWIHYFNCFLSDAYSEVKAVSDSFSFVLEQMSTLLAALGCFYHAAPYSILDSKAACSGFDVLIKRLVSAGTTVFHAGTGNFAYLGLLTDDLDLVVTPGSEMFADLESLQKVLASALDDTETSTYRIVRTRDAKSPAGKMLYINSAVEMQVAGKTYALDFSFSLANTARAQQAEVAKKVVSPAACWRDVATNRVIMQPDLFFSVLRKEIEVIGNESDVFALKQLIRFYCAGFKLVDQTSILTKLISPKSHSPVSVETTRTMSHFLCKYLLESPERFALYHQFFVSYAVYTKAHIALHQPMPPNTCYSVAVNAISTTQEKQRFIDVYQLSLLILPCASFKALQSVLHLFIVGKNTLGITGRPRDAGYIKNRISQIGKAYFTGSDGHLSAHDRYVFKLFQPIALSYHQELRAYRCHAAANAAQFVSLANGGAACQSRLS